MPEETENAGTQENALKDTDELEEKLAASKAAWAEWETYMDERVDREVPDSMKFVLGKGGVLHSTENEDGTVELLLETREGEELRTVSMEDWKQYEAWVERQALLYGGYDLSYRVHSEEDACKLEEIAGKYGVNLRKSMRSALSSETSGISGTGFLTNQQLAEKTAEIGCAGNIFYETPVGFDKVYWYDEGTFCVSYYVDLPSSGERVTCYGYNSMYSTLSSGKEVINWERNIDSFTQRSHTAPDGTELSILSNGRDAYIYVYLENSFFAMHVHSENGVTEEDVDYIADTLNYSLIGQG